MELRKPNPSELTDLGRLLTDVADAAYDAQRELPESLFRPFSRPSFNRPFSDEMGRQWRKLENLGFLGVGSNSSMRVR